MDLQRKDGEYYPVERHTGMDSRTTRTIAEDMIESLLRKMQQHGEAAGVYVVQVTDGQEEAGGEPLALVDAMTVVESVVVHLRFQLAKLRRQRPSFTAEVVSENDLVGVAITLGDAPVAHVRESTAWRDLGGSS